MLRVPKIPQEIQRNDFSTDLKQQNPGDTASLRGNQPGNFTEVFKEAASKFAAQLEKLSPNFSSSWGIIRVNLLHLEPSLPLYGLSCIISKVFPILANNYFQVSFNLKVIFLRGQTNSKIRELIPLIHLNFLEF